MHFREPYHIATYNSLRQKICIHISPCEITYSYINFVEDYPKRKGAWKKEKVEIHRYTFDIHCGHVAYWWPKSQSRCMLQGMLQLWINNEDSE